MSIIWYNPVTVCVVFRPAQFFLGGFCQLTRHVWGWNQQPAEAMPAMQGEVRNLARSKGDSWLMLAAVAGSGCHVLIPLITQ